MTDLAAVFNQTETLTLPSNGFEVTVKRPDVGRLAMANAGDVPTPILNQLLASLNTGKAVEATDGWGRDDLPRLNTFIDMLVKVAFVYPSVVDENPDYEAGQIAISDLTTDDRFAVFSWAMPQEADAASKFRDQQNSRVGTAQSGKRVPAKAK